MPLFEYEGTRPTIADDAFVAPTATIKCILQQAKAFFFSLVGRDAKTHAGTEKVHCGLGILKHIMLVKLLDKADKGLLICVIAN